MSCECNTYVLGDKCSQHDGGNKNEVLEFRQTYSLIVPERDAATFHATSFVRSGPLSNCPLVHCRMVPLSFFPINANGTIGDIFAMRDRNTFYTVIVRDRRSGDKKGKYRRIVTNEYCRMCEGTIGKRGQRNSVIEYVATNKRAQHVHDHREVEEKTSNRYSRSVFTLIFPTTKSTPIKNITTNRPTSESLTSRCNF